jgi:ATP-binding cassette subfamily E protein 1
MRVAVLDADSCQPKRCALECYRYCPGVRMGDETIVFEEGMERPLLSEELCTGCGICIKKCPFEAITIVGLPEELKEGLIHQYGENAFRLFRLPHPGERSVTGLIGQNGIGKTTIVRILAGDLVPNLGDLEGSEKEKVLDFFSGTQFHDYFEALYSGGLTAVLKPQYVDSIPRHHEGTVEELLSLADQKGDREKVTRELELTDVLDREISEVSGGELQRLAIAACLVREGDFYIFDEPSSYLDVGQRLKVAKVLRKLAQEKRVLVVEHDLILLDYLADYVNLLYGKPGAYGIVSHPRSVRQGINVYLEGYLREENIRFREGEIRFEVRPPSKGWEHTPLLRFGALSKTLDGFSLEVEEGEIHRGEVVGVLGPNAIGKTTFVRMLAGEISPDWGGVEIQARISYKPQYLRPPSGLSVLPYIQSGGEGTPDFQAEVAQPLGLEKLYDRNLEDLSGGELQKTAIAACLWREAEIYLLDEPSAYLDVEERIRISKTLRRVMEKREATGIVVDHDLLFLDYLSDRLIVFSGQPGRVGRSRGPLEMKEGMNAFLKEMGITFRRDPETGRPRANKEGSQKDQEQRRKGTYYYSAP